MTIGLLCISAPEDKDVSAGASTLGSLDQIATMQ
jgi:hypothetical protein